MFPNQAGFLTFEFFVYFGDCVLAVKNDFYASPALFSWTVFQFSPFGIVLFPLSAAVIVGNDAINQYFGDSYLTAYLIDIANDVFGLEALPRPRELVAQQE